MRKHLRLWASHAALNLGAACASIVHAVVPPQFTHNAEDRARLLKGTPVQWFINGIRGHGHG